ncbi:MAG: serine protease [Candidatus Aminicenantes bacterium]|nr:serine protease [Candidatus Aminicenantes bacterium]
MLCQIKSPFVFSVEQLDRELIARGAQIPREERLKFLDMEGTPIRNDVMASIEELYSTAPILDETMCHLSIQDIIEMLIEQTIKEKHVKGIWLKDDRLDYYEIEDEQIKKNADCVAAVCMKNNLVDMKNGFSEIEVKNFGRTFNLCQREPFHHHPTAAGPMCSGFLVKEDTIATAAHFVHENNLKDLCFVFGFKMVDISTPVIQLPNENIYKGIEIVDRKYNDKVNGADWALVKLDRRVFGQTVAKLSEKAISNHYPAYVLGHPMGLPLKFAPGICLDDVNDACFSAQLDMYSGNSGSPIFDGNTHEAIGIVVRGYQKDLRCTGKCWISVIYPKHDICSKSPQCTRVSEFIHVCK